LTRLSGPRQERWFWSGALVRALGQLRPGEFDLLHLDELCLTRMLPRALAVAHVQHHHKLDQEWMHATWRGGPRRRLEARRWERLERGSVARARAQLFVSDADARRFTERHSIRCSHVLENGVNTTEFRPENNGREEQHLLFLGTLDYIPNARGLELFLRVAWPELRRHRPRLHLSLVGRGERSKGLRELPDGVSWVGPVEDVRPWLASAAALVVPLDIGGGTRLKIIEAAAMGCPVVSTRIGAEGLRFRDGVDLLLAPTIDTLVPCILETLDSPAQSRMRSACAREVVAQHHDWNHLARQLATVWEETIVQARE